MKRRKLHIIYGMRIAIFTDIYAPWGTGGVAAAVKAQKDELERLGHEVVVFCPGRDAQEKDVVTVPSHAHVKVSRTIVALRPEKIIEFVTARYPEFDFDVVHVHYEASCSVAGVLLAQKFKRPLVQTMHGREDMAIAVNVPHPLKLIVASLLNHLHRHYIPYEIKVKRDKFQAPTFTRAKMWEIMVNQAQAADMVIAPSDHFAKKLEHYGVEKPIVPIPNGVESELVEEDYETRVLEDGAVLKMIWNSRVSHEKRLLPFLHALELLHRPYLLHVYGSGNELKKAQKYAERHHLKVKFYGMQKREKILKRMREAHLSVVASYNFDTQGMVLLEAEATGLPVFFCDPNMMEIVPRDSFVLAGGPEAEAMAISLEALPAEKIEKMSAKMLAARKNITQELATRQILKAYRSAREAHTNDTKSQQS